MKRVLMYDTKGVAYPNKTKNICTDTNDSIRPAWEMLTRLDKRREDVNGWGFLKEYRTHSYVLCRLRRFYGFSGTTDVARRPLRRRRTMDPRTIVRR